MKPKKLFIVLEPFIFFGITIFDLGTLRFIILDGIGQVKIVEHVDKDKILNSLKI